ncbi:ParB/RepB/Spo0J family partition protein [Acidicapsa acidisoli]|uniref:ParB/RepB/Spo0J family partition protein n=1 Tax=Acidicapsa acidisoli TaxID=1615681 RepID=UPI0021DFE011|nr:ParB/RepB/Spo0J family partition protein [Acidicapsa acidisoli]
MTTTTTISLNKLLAWGGNVRKTESDKNIDELAASISAHGLLQSLVVRKDKRDKYAVVAGGRRLLALQSLADAGTLEADYPVPCNVIGLDTDATEISLAENVQREAMHPADEFEAFKALIESGTPPADVAARFGVTETVVKQRMKLAHVSPKLVAAYRRGKMTLQHIMAFAVTDDHAAQERVWREVAAWKRGNPDAIRDMLTEGEITGADPRVRFVSVKAYEKAGGTVRRDLFSEGDDGVFIDDAVLLESLVAKKLDSVAAAVRKQGWRWVEIEAIFDHDAWSKCQRFHPEPTPFSPEEQSEYDALLVEREELWALEDLDEGQVTRLDAVEERLAELGDRETVWSPETLGIAGVVVTLGRDGKAELHYGLVRPEDAPRKTSRREAGAPDVTENSGDGASPLPVSLVESLTAQRSAALSAALLDHPEAALALLVERLALPVFYSGPHDDGLLQITPRTASFHRVEGSAAHATIESAHAVWRLRLPADSEALLGWCFMQSVATLQGLLTFCVAQTVNAVQSKDTRSSSPRMAQSETLAALLNLDMALWFSPTGANYFGRASKATIIGNLEEIKGAVAPAWTAMKKTELASLAEREAAKVRWIPAMLRLPQPQPALESIAAE